MPRPKETPPRSTSTRSGAQEPSSRRLARLDRMGYLLDNSIRLPGIGYRIGYDAVLGLIPGVGDAVGLLLSAYIVFEAARFGIPKGTLLRMVGNVGVEALVGVVPLLGDLFDATWKANARNLNLLHAHLGLEPRTKAPSTRRALLLLAGGLLVFIVLLALVIVVIVEGLARLLG